MNIYCVIFMCTFGSNSTDTETPMSNSLIEGSNNGNFSRNGTATTTLADVAAMILPERGEPVPHKGDIVMELPKIRNDATKNLGDSSQDDLPVSTSPQLEEQSPTLSDILLPPSAKLRKNLVDNDKSK